MIPFLLYVFVATVVAALFNRLGLKWYEEEFRHCDGPPKIAFAITYGVFWPITLFFGAPVILTYKGVNKLVDKFTKV